MEDGLEMNKETIQIEGGRNLYNYTFHPSGPQDRLLQMIETGEVGVIGPFLDQHPELQLGEALELARRLGREEAVSELCAR